MAQQPGSQLPAAAQKFLWFWGMHRCCKENRAAAYSPPAPFSSFSITGTTKVLLH